MHRHKLVIIICLIAASGQMFVPAADGLAGEYVATQRWRDMLSRHSPLANPAFLTEENYVSFRACEALVLDNTFNLTEVGVALPVGLYRSLGFTYMGEGTALPLNKMQWRSDNSGAIDSLGRGSNRNNLFMLSYADNLWGRLSIGANLSMSHSTLFGSPRFGLAGDIGLSYRLFLDPAMGEHLLGISLQNILQPLTDLLPASGSFTSQGYSNNVKLSWSAYLWERQFDAGIDVDVKNLYGSMVKLKGEQKPGVAEYGVSLRLGGWLVRMFNAYVQVGTDYWAGTVGINFPQVNFGRDFSVLYQYMNVTNIENVPVQSFYFRMDLGQHREESYARMMARRWNVAPNELYNKALRLYMAQNYWDAFFVFSQLAAQYPSFVKNDMVTYFRGACLEKMDMREGAEQYYKETIRQYGASEIAPHAELGLMRLYYREGNAASLADRFTRMAPSPAPDSLKYHGYYLMAETRMKEKDFTEAKRLFSRIPQHHAEYVFAQHSAAVAALAADRRAEAIEHLANCINAKTQTAAGKECVNRSYLYLGYLFYENLELSKAITALRTIPATSYYYEDALLGMCWTALKAKQWDACIEYGQTLRKISSHAPLRCDAMLITGYAYLMQKKYNDANVVLKEADGQLGSLSIPDSDSLARVRARNGKVRADYGDIGRMADRISVMAQTSENIGTIDSLHKAQQEGKAALDGFAVFSDEFARSSLFGRNADAIKSDIAFTFAIAQKFSRESKALEEQEKMQGKQNKIDEKIEQMKKELEKLNSGNK
jgi:outer membrane protein assembly factor BamD (BamD/ComL family)